MYRKQSEFAIDVAKGLSAMPRYLLPKYLYDEKGSEIFRKIMRMEEYYLTRCEYEIFNEQTEAIVNWFKKTNSKFDLVEFGAGDGLKSKLLIRHLVDKNIPFRYVPIDISTQPLNQLIEDVKEEFPEVDVNGMNGDYFEMIRELVFYDETPKVVLFLGSNLGNMNFKQSVEFLSQLELIISKNDFFLLGLDLQKDPKIVSYAYDDLHGYTRDFNLNLLTRINRELGGNFDLSKWQHFEAYDIIDKAAKSYLVSKEKQEVSIKQLGRTFQFDAWEAVYTEMSQKYSLEMIEELARLAGFRVLENFYDSKKYFVDTLWQPRH